VKKLSAKQRWWLKRKGTLLRKKKRPIHGRKKQLRNQTSNSATEYLQSLSSKGVLNYSRDKNGIYINMPDSFNLHKDYNQSIAPLLAIRQLSEIRHRHRRTPLRWINFDFIRRMSTSASLILAAELDVWNRSINRRLKAKPDNWDQDIKRQFCELGLFKLLGLDEPSHYTSNEGSKKLVKYFVGGADDSSLAKELREKIEDLVGGTIKRQELFQGISEAITNVTHHAYPGNNLHKLWWMTASFDKETRRLKVVFYDRGISIPKSLPRSSLWEQARGYLTKHGLHLKDDANLIKAAMEMGRTETGKSNRGKGLQDLLDFTKSYKNGFLSILSRHGQYKFNFDSAEKIELKQLDYKMPGTLIVWSVCLPANE
jgi:hypothetical protein